jgi:hypothetical protein
VLPPWEDPGLQPERCEKSRGDLICLQPWIPRLFLRLFMISVALRRALHSRTRWIYNEEQSAFGIARQQQRAQRKTLRISGTHTVLEPLGMEQVWKQPPPSICEQPLRPQRVWIVLDGVSLLQPLHTALAPCIAPQEPKQERGFSRPGRAWQGYPRLRQQLQ